ncbi:MAG: TolC family protein [Spirochaetaceae bacterium]|nr:MAG: TolC family protein [Spirochaetaceae bacterium]
MKRIKTLMLVLGFSLLAVSVFPIELEEYIDLVKENHPFFLKEELAVEVEKSDRETRLPRYEWRYSLMPQYTVLDGPVSSEFFENLAQNATLQAGVQRSYADGRRMGFAASTGYTWMQNPPETFEKNAFQHGIEASISWQLKKNLELLARLDYDVREYNIKAKEVEILENQESFLVDPAILFIDWAYALELVAIYQQRLVLAEEQLATTNRMFRSNLIERLDVLRAEDAVRMAQQAIFEYESLAKSIQAELATLSASQGIYEEKPVFDFYSFVELPPANEAASRGKSNTRLKQPLLIVIEQLRYQSEAFGEREKATLDLFVEAGIYGPEDTFVESLEIIHPQATVGLSYSPPTGLEQVAAERAYISTQIRKLEKEIEAIEKTVETNVTTLLIQAVELEKVIELNRQLIESAEEKASEEARLYNQGRNMLTNVILSRDGVQAQKAKLVDNFARYHRLIIAYRAFMDELLK